MCILQPMRAMVEQDRVVIVFYVQERQYSCHLFWIIVVVYADKLQAVDFHAAVSQYFNPQGLQATHDLIQILRRAREEWFVELLAHFPDDVETTDADLVATVLLIVGAIHYFIVLGRLQTDFSGIEIDTDAGWERIDQIISTIFERTFEASG